MMRAWIALALLSVAWLLGLGYYQPASWSGFALVLVLGTVLLATRPAPVPPPRQLAVALVMFLPALWVMPWPDRAAPLAISIGLALQLLLPAPRWPRRVGWGAVTAGVVMLGQSLAVAAYAGQTARSHDLPWPLPSLLGWIASLLGIDAAVDGKTLVMYSMREVHRLAATWDLFFDPATLSFFTGGLILLGILASGRLPEGHRWKGWIRCTRTLAVVILAWLPLRAGLVMALFLHRVLRADPTARLTVMDQFLSPWVQLLLLTGPVLLAWWFVRMPAADSDGTEGKKDPSAGRGPRTDDQESNGQIGRRQCAAALALVCAGAALVSFTAQWDPVGRRKGGRVMVVERHSTWEPTDRAYDKDSFGHDPSYSYTKIYDYCSQFYEMSRLLESDSIDHETLSRCDVLVVKIPTARFSGREVQAIVDFVEAGGGLLLVGDHTNVFHSSTYLNDVARRFGFIFRHDLLFCVGSPYDQELCPPAVPHPAVQHLPPMHYAVSCSIDPGRSLGRAVVQSTGLWSLPPDYHAENYHPQAEYRADMRYGAFIQLWAVRHGAGRVLAFTDSTIFSNFSTFQPGKAELMIGMLEWLNYTSVLDRPWARWAAVGLSLLAALALLAVGLRLARGCRIAWLTVVAAAVLGATVGSMVVVVSHRLAMPEPQAVRPVTQLVIDRTLSEVPLSRGAYPVDAEGRGYGLFEQWIPRLGYYTKRASGREAFSGDALVVICPTQSVTEEFREGVVDYVAGGGKLLVIDSPEVVGSTANSLLWPFEMAVNHGTEARGALRLTDDWPPKLEVEVTCEVLGGTPLTWIGETPVAAGARYGKGSVMAVGFGSLLNDAGMGMSWMQEPDAQLLTRFDLLFALIEALVEDRPITAPTARRPDVPVSPEQAGRGNAPAIDHQGPAEVTANKA